MARALTAPGVPRKLPPVPKRRQNRAAGAVGGHRDLAGGVRKHGREELHRRDAETRRKQREEQAKNDSPVPQFFSASLRLRGENPTASFGGHRDLAGGVRKYGRERLHRGDAETRRKQREEQARNDSPVLQFF